MRGRTTGCMVCIPIYIYCVYTYVMWVGLHEIAVRGRTTGSMVCVYIYIYIVCIHM